MCTNKNCGKNGFCVNGKCICKQRYALNSENCIIDEFWCQKNCPEGCATSKEEVVCNCSSHKYRLSSDTGLCHEINYCEPNEIGRKQCDNQKSICIQTNDNKGYEC